mgnify:CR=1 FL=1
MEFYLSGGKIESGLIETINDESISQDSANIFNSIKQKLLKKAEKNLRHYSIQDWSVDRVSQTLSDLIVFKHKSGSFLL